MQTGVAAIGYYILQPLKQNCLTKNHFENDNRTLSSYEITINYLAHSLGLQPYNTILPVQKTSQSKQSKESDCGESSAEDSEVC